MKFSGSYTSGLSSGSALYGYTSMMAVSAVSYTHLKQSLCLGNFPMLKYKLSLGINRL